MNEPTFACPQPACVAEMDGILELMVKSFPQAKSPEHFTSRYPHLYRHNVEEAGNHLVINAGGQCIGHLGLFPATLAIGSGRLKAGCIGGVCTHPDFRNQRVAGRLLEYGISRMQEQGVDLSILGGVRELYGKYGWELAGHKITFTVKRSSLIAHGIKPAYVLRQYAGNEGDLETIAHIHQAEPFYFIRSREIQDLLLKKVLFQSWLSQNAYVTGDANTFIEGGGDANEFISLVLRVMHEKDIASVNIERPYWADGINRLLFRVASDWKIENVMSIRFLNLYRVFDAYLNSMKVAMPHRRSGNLEPITLEIAGTGERATLHFKDHVHATPEETSNKLSLSAMEMVRLVFGDYVRFEFPRRFPETGFDVLNDVFPLPFHLWGLDRF